ncbi:MAG: ABC transporter substrate-binding protein [Anaerovoracaceae bacterium]|jgi:ABC-type nitrate/sulfonate/bicarbonate transport system substrate-binding protein
MKQTSETGKAAEYEIKRRSRRSGKRGFRAAVLLLTLVLCAGLLAACGGSDSSSDSGGKAAKEEKVTMRVAAYKGVGTAITGKLRGDYKITSYSEPAKMEAALRRGSYDAAILPTASADNLYGRAGGGLIEVSPASRGGMHLVSCGYVTSSTRFSALAGKTIYVSGANTTDRRVFDALMTEAGIGSASYKIKVLKSCSEVEKALRDEGNIAVLSEPYYSSFKKKNSSITDLFDLGSEWQKATDTELVGDAVVVRRGFWKKHPGAFEDFCDDMTEAVKDADSAADLVFYGQSDRGARLLEHFNDYLYQQAPASFAGGRPGSRLYETVQ